MILAFTPKGWEDYLALQQQDAKLCKRVHQIVQDIQRNPFQGIAKPEPLKHEFAGFWSRRINAEHRLIYEVKSDTVIIHQCRYHY